MREDTKEGQDFFMDHVVEEPHEMIARDILAMHVSGALEWLRCKGLLDLPFFFNSKSTVIRMSRITSKAMFS